MRCRVLFLLSLVFSCLQTSSIFIENEEFYLPSQFLMSPHLFTISLLNFISLHLVVELRFPPRRRYCIWFPLLDTFSKRPRMSYGDVLA